MDTCTVFSQAVHVHSLAHQMLVKLEVNKMTHDVNLAHWYWKLLRILSLRGSGSRFDFSKM